MYDRIREEYVAKINNARNELKTAGMSHGRDMKKHIRRMKKELRDYDRFHREVTAHAQGPAGRKP